MGSEHYTCISPKNKIIKNDKDKSLKECFHPNLRRER
ncbi:MAG: hypothetical protein ACI94Y_003412 [Maribacter sp.]|jgi:hypothetical protein